MYSMCGAPYTVRRCRCLRLFVQSARRQDWEEVPISALVFQVRLGHGASGEVRAALWNG